MSSSHHPVPSAAPLAAPSAARRRLALVILCAATLMIILDGTIVTVALPVIQADLGFTPASLSWVMDSYLIAFGGLLLLSGSNPAAGWWNVVQLVFFPLLAACWLASLAGQAVSYRRSSGERRQQLKWLLAGTAVVLVSAPLSVLLSLLKSPSWVGILVLAGFVALPVSIGVAVLRYRLFDIDRIISRTLAYAIVTGLLVGLYAGLVLLATRVLSFHSTVAVAAATLAAAALFNPVRKRVQLRVDRRFNRARYDADQMVAGFAARLKDTVDLDSVRDDLASVVYQALEPAHVSVWISHRD